MDANGKASAKRSTISSTEDAEEKIKLVRSSSETLEEPAEPDAESTSSATCADVPSAKLPSNIDSLRAVKAFENRLEALTSLLQSNLSSISTSLRAKSIISEAEQQEAMKEMVIPKTRTVSLLNVVLNKIKFEPQVFVEVVKSIESELSFRKQAHELVHCYQGLPSTPLSPLPTSAADITSLFPYLRASSTEDEDRISMLQECLYQETNKLKIQFGSLMYDMVEDLEKRLSTEKIRRALVFYDSNFERVLSNCTSFDSVFLKVRKSVSFFDYDLLEHLIEKFGSDSIKKVLDEYRGYFEAFAKRRVTECPSNAFDGGERELSEKVLVLVADKIITDLTVEELKKFKHRINLILGDKLVKVLFVNGGSICLTFRVFEDKNFTITEKQRQALQKEGVVSITYGDQYFDMQPKSNFQSSVQI